MPASLTRVRRRALAAIGGTLAVLPVAVSAHASAPPVGPLPPGPTSTVETSRGSLVAVALPALRRGLVWRIARPLDARVLRQAGEGEIGPSIVVVFRAVGRGDARVAFAATRGETRAALRSFVQRVHVR